MPFSYDRTWQDVMGMIRAGWPLLLTLAGVFIFFPAYVMFVAAPMPEPQQDAPADASFKLIYAYYQANLLWLMLVNAIAAFGQAAMLALLLDRDQPTVGEALGVAGRLFPAYFAMQLLTNFVIGAGFVLLLVPGLYLLGRLSVVGPLMIARTIGNPLTAISGGWRMTDRRGWRITGLVMLVVIVGWIVSSAATSVLTVAGALIVAADLRPLVAGFAGGLSSAALALLLTVLTAAIYRQLTQGDRLGETFR